MSAAHLHLFDGVAHGSERTVVQQLLAHHFRPDHCKHTESRSDPHTDNTEASWEHVAVQKSSDKTISECIETSGEKTSEMVRFMLLYGLKRT